MHRSLFSDERQFGKDTMHIRIVLMKSEWPEFSYLIPPFTVFVPGTPAEIRPVRATLKLR